MQHLSNGLEAQEADEEGGGAEETGGPGGQPARPPHPGEKTGGRTDPARGPTKRRRPGRPAAATPVGEMETRELVLRQARQLFMRRGYADVSVGEVAEAVGVTKPTLYYHFGGKEGLYAAVLVHLMQEVGGYIRAVVEQGTPLRERLRQVAFGYFVNASGTMEPMLRDVGQLIGAEYATTVWAAYEGEFQAPLLALIAEGQLREELRPVEPRGLVRAFIGLLDAFTAPGGKTARAPAEHLRVAEQVVSLFLDGAAPRC